MVHYVALCNVMPVSKVLRYDPCVTRESQFYLPPTHEPYLWFTPQLQRIIVLYPVTHPSTNRAQRRLTSLIRTNALSLHQTTIHGRKSQGVGGTSPPRIWSRAIVPPPQILSCCKILSTRLLALHCRKMCFLSLQQDFYKSCHASPQNSSQIYAYATICDVKVM